jgi:hypothetical protein
MDEKYVKEAFDISTDEMELKLELGKFRISYFIFRSNVFQNIFTSNFQFVLDLREIDEHDELFCENDENDPVDLPIVRDQIELEPYDMILKSEPSGKLHM